MCPGIINVKKSTPMISKEGEKAYIVLIYVAEETLNEILLCRPIILLFIYFYFLPV